MAALTNAERQRLHRRRVRERLDAAAQPSRLELAAAALRQEMLSHVASFQAELESGEDFEVADIVIGAMSGDYYAVEALLPVILAALDMPADPWPGLTGEQLTQMTKGRLNEARRRGLRSGMMAVGELNLRDKVIAARHRDWLLDRATKNVT